MLGKIFEALYSKAFVNILTDDNFTKVYIEVVSKKEVLLSVEDVFETEGAAVEEMHEFISSYISETPYNYISVLDISIRQGAIPTCSKKRMDYFYDISGCEHKCYANKWTYYTYLDEIYKLEDKYKEFGVDLIFSPFVVLANFFKDKIDTYMAMYILILDGYMALAVFDNSELLYAEYMDTKHIQENEDILSDDMSSDLDDNIDLDDVAVDDVEDMESLDDFADIEDLDTLEDMDEFSESKDIEEELQVEAEEEVEVNSSFGDDYNRFTMIQNSINHFYKDERYDSQFIETAYIADNVGISGDLKKYLEEEMFLSVYVRKIDVVSEICDLAKVETGA